MTKRTVGVDLVKRWAHDAIQGWLTGRGELSETEYVDYHIRKLPDGCYEVRSEDPEVEPACFHIWPIVVIKPQ